MDYNREPKKKLVLTMSSAPVRKQTKSTLKQAISPPISASKEDVQAEKRLQARNIIYTELIFVLIPFIFLGIIAVEESFAGIFTAMRNLALGPELALVSSLLYGQTCVKLISGLAKKNIPKWYIGTRRTAGFLALTIICAFLYARISYTDVKSIPYAILQVLFFFHSIISFIVFGSVGQRLMDISEKTEVQ